MPRRKLCCTGALAIVALGSVFLLPPVAHGQTQVSVDVNGKAVVTAKGAALPGAMGSAVAAAKAFNAAPASSYTVNGATPPNANEVTILDGLAASAKPIATTKNPADRAAYINGGMVGGIPVPGIKNLVTSCTAPNATPGNCSVIKPANNTFLLVNKGAGITSTAGPVQTAGGEEFATATAKQTLNAAAGTYTVTNNPVTQAKASRTVPNPIAVAFTSNRDPMAIEWTSAGSRTVTINLSELALTLFSSGLGTGGVGYFEADASLIDGTTDVSLSESDAIPLYSLLIAASTFDGAPATVDTAAFSLSAAGAISDSLGDVGLANVQSGLLGDLALVGNTIEFATPYSITVTLPGVADNSVLFLHDSAFAESVVPEPASLSLFGAALASLGLIRRRRNMI